MKVKELEEVVDGLSRRMAVIENVVVKRPTHDELHHTARNVREDLHAAMEEVRDAQRLVNIGLTAMLIVVAVSAAVFLG